MGREMYLMSGAGNNFVMVDGRAMPEEELAALRRPEHIRALCSKYGTDGLEETAFPPARPPARKARISVWNSTIPTAAAE